MSKYLNVNDYVNTVEKVAYARGKEYTLNDWEKTSYSYALGYVLSNFKYCLDELNLSEKQLQVLANRTEWLNNNGVD
jgi:hypothetical protein